MFMRAKVDPEATHRTHRHHQLFTRVDEKYPPCIVRERGHKLLPRELSRTEFFPQGHEIVPLVAFEPSDMDHHGFVVFALHLPNEVLHTLTPIKQAT
jgi:hypothetical protein